MQRNTIHPSSDQRHSWVSNCSNWCLFPLRHFLFIKTDNLSHLGKWPNGGQGVAIEEQFLTVFGSEFGYVKVVWNVPCVECFPMGKLFVCEELIVHHFHKIESKDTPAAQPSITEPDTESWNLSPNKLREITIMRQIGSSVLQSHSWDCHLQHWVYTYQVKIVKKGQELYLHGKITIWE